MGRGHRGGEGQVAPVGSACGTSTGHGPAPLPTGMLWDRARRWQGLDGRSCPYRHRLLPLLRPAFRLFTINQHLAAKNTQGEGA